MPREPGSGRWGFHAFPAAVIPRSVSGNSRQSREPFRRGGTVPNVPDTGRSIRPTGRSRQAVETTQTHPSVSTQEPFGKKMPSYRNNSRSALRSSTHGTSVALRGASICEELLPQRSTRRPERAGECDPVVGTHARHFDVGEGPTDVVQNACGSWPGDRDGAGLVRCV